MIKTENIKKLYDDEVSENLFIHKYIFSKVFGKNEYIGQYSDNSASEIKEFGQQLNLSRKSLILDIGSGNGCISNYLSKKFDWNITGIDIGEKNYLKALENNSLEFKNQQLHFVNDDLYIWEPNIKFNGAYGIGSFCHFRPDDLFLKVASLLHQEGKIGFMERIKLNKEFTTTELENLTTNWHCPGVYTIAEYKCILSKNFKDIQVVDMSDNVKEWHAKSVSVREELKNLIIDLTSEEYYTKSLNLAKYEADVCLSDKLGYAMFIATKK